MERYYTDGTEPDVLPHYSRHCSGPCDQGRRDCPFPVACQVEERQVNDAVKLLVLVCLAVTVVAGAVLVLAAVFP
tara:strand:- start:8558 stop:8782 length:225 start_codon:yes stop_codon:yes gene_type:complete